MPQPPHPPTSFLTPWELLLSVRAARQTPLQFCNEPPALVFTAPLPVFHAKQVPEVTWTGTIGLEQWRERWLRDDQKFTYFFLERNKLKSSVEVI